MKEPCDSFSLQECMLFEDYILEHGQSSRTLVKCSALARDVIHYHMQNMDEDKVCRFQNSVAASVDKLAENQPDRP